MQLLASSEENGPWYNYSPLLKYHIEPQYTNTCVWCIIQKNSILMDLKVVYRKCQTKKVFFYTHADEESTYYLIITNIKSPMPRNVDCICHY